MTRSLPTSVGLLLLAACSNADEAKQIVTAEFRDPDSAQFRNVEDVTDAIGGKYVCGEVNGRNGYGGYTGYRKFVVDMAKGSAMIEPEREPGDDGTLYDLQMATFNLVAYRCDL